MHKGIIKTKVYGETMNMIDINKNEYRDLVSLGRYIPQNKEAVILADEPMINFLTASTNENVYTVSAGRGDNYNKTPRGICSNYLLSNWDLATMKGIGVKYLVTLPGSNLDTFAKNDSLHVRKIDIPAYYSLFELNISEDSTAHIDDRCVFEE